jgi:hypothetical protein
MADNKAPPLDPSVAEGLRKAVYAFASFGSAEQRVDLDGKVRADEALLDGRARGRKRKGEARAIAHTRERSCRRRRSLDRPTDRRKTLQKTPQKTPQKIQAWAKLCRDCDLLKPPSFTATDADLLFARVKPKGGRRIGLEGVVAALELAAQRRGCSALELAHRVAAAGGPSAADGCTVAEPVRLHDDKATYTGVYARGGPTTVDADPSSLAAVCDRSAADVRGVSATMGVAATASAGLLAAVPSAAVTASSSKRLRAGASASSLAGRASITTASASASASRKGLTVLPSSSSSSAGAAPAPFK